MSDVSYSTMGEEQKPDLVIDDPGVLGAKVSVEADILEQLGHDEGSKSARKSSVKIAKKKAKKKGLFNRKSKIKEAKLESEVRELEGAENGENEAKAKADFYEKVLDDYLEADKAAAVQNLIDKTMEILGGEAQRKLETIQNEQGEEIEAGNEVIETDGLDEVYEDVFWEDEESWDDYADNRVELYDDEHKFQLYELPASILRRYPFIQELPERIAITGGMARSLARELITDEREPIRKIEMINIVDSDGTCYVDRETMDQLTEEYMPDEFEAGRVMGYDTLENYFDSRDLTINQVLIMNGQLIVSNAAKNDFQENIVRPSHDSRPCESSPVSSELLFRALLMKAMSEDFTKSVPTIEDIQVGEVDPVDVAVGLDQAISRSVETAHAFTRELAEWGIIPRVYSNRPMAAAKLVSQQMMVDEEIEDEASDDYTDEASSEEEMTKVEVEDAESDAYELIDEPEMVEV